jgi:hypothetical protein
MDFRPLRRDALQQTTIKRERTFAPAACFVVVVGGLTVVRGAGGGDGGEGITGHTFSEIAVSWNETLRLGIKQ